MDEATYSKRSIVNHIRGSDKICVLCRGSSVKSFQLDRVDASTFFLVGQFSNALRKMDKGLRDRNVLQIINKCAIEPHRKTYERFNITDIQCNFGWKGGMSLDSSKLSLYKKVCKKNPWANVYLTPRDVLKERNVLIEWDTTGIYALHLASFYAESAIEIFGLDFYASSYFSKEKQHVPVKSNKKRAPGMLKMFYRLARGKPHLKFIINTKSGNVKPKLDNLEVRRV